MYDPLELLIRIKPEYCEYDGHVVNLHQSQVTFQQLVSEYNSHMNSLGYLAVGNGTIDPKSAAYLRSRGWIHLQTAKDREEGKLLKEEYYLVEETKTPYSYQQRYSKIDIEKLTEVQLDQLSRGGKIVQVVDPKSVLTASDQKKLRTRVNQLENAKQKFGRKKVKQLTKKMLDETGETPFG